MTFEDSPEARDEIDRLLVLDPDNFVEEDSFRTSGSLLDLGRIIIRSLRAMTPAEMQSLRDALNRKLPGEGFTGDDVLFLRSIGSNLE